MRFQQSQPSEEFYAKYIIKEDGGEEIFNRETCGFSDYEYEIALKVLHAMTSDHQKRTILIQHPKFKPLRDELRDFKKGNTTMNSNARKEAKEEIARQKDQNKAFINQAANMCSEMRVKKLQER